VRQATENMGAWLRERYRSMVPESVRGLIRKMISRKSSPLDDYIKKFGGLVETVLPSVQLARPLPLNFTVPDETSLRAPRMPSCL
jgi:hypothetical protein